MTKPKKKPAAKKLSKKKLFGLDAKSLENALDRARQDAVIFGMGWCCIDHEMRIHYATPFQKGAQK
jgi:hypothetical protein